MPGYIEKLLQRFLHPIPKKPKHQPHCHVQPQYITKVQLTQPGDKTPLLKHENINKLHQIIGAVLYYARAVDGTLMTILNELASTQSKGTQANMQAIKKLMDNCHTHSDTKIRYCASQMKLYIHINVSYLSASKSRSRVEGHFFLSENFNPTSQTKHNGAVLVVAAILENVMASVPEALLGGLLINDKEGEVLITSLEEMGHPQGPTHMQTDNSMSSGIINKTVKQHIFKAIEIRFYWVRDICKQNHFLIY